MRRIALVTTGFASSMLVRIARSQGTHRVRRCAESRGFTMRFARSAMRRIAFARDELREFSAASSRGCSIGTPRDQRCVGSRGFATNPADSKTQESPKTRAKRDFRPKGPIDSVIQCRRLRSAVGEAPVGTTPPTTPPDWRPSSLPFPRTRRVYSREPDRRRHPLRSVRA